MRKLSEQVLRQAWISESGKRARDSMLSFARFIGEGHWKDNWHHRLICDVLDRWARREEGFRRVMLFMPPQNGKSTLVSRFLPAYTLGHNPDAHFISASYSSGLATEFNRDLQLIMESTRYRATFPSVLLPTPKDRGYTRTTEQIDLVGRRGGYRSTGVGGSITGHGAHYFVIDDPIKNAEEAYSETYRENLWSWFVTTAYTRQSSSDAAILITVTRWHQDDLCGRLLKLENEGGEKWLVVRFPAVADERLYAGDPRIVGDPLWPDRFPLDMLSATRKQVGERTWQAMYQQEPTADEGSEIKRHWWRWYEEAPSDFEFIACSWDCAFKDDDTSDFVVGQTWGVIGAERYLLDQVRERLDFPATIQAVKSMRERWHPNIILVEDKANGSAVVQMLRKEVPGIVAVEPQGGKVTRARAVAPQVEAGQVFLPRGRQFSNTLVEECAAFPLGANDDQVDAMSQALTYLLHFGKRPADPMLHKNVAGDTVDVKAFKGQPTNEIMKIFGRR